MKDQSMDDYRDSSGEHNWDENETQGEKNMDNPPDRDNILIPKLGMIFGSEEEAFQFYMAYGYHTGFGIVRRSNNTIDGFRYRSTFICARGGNPRNKTYKENAKKKGSKTGCKAKMSVKDHHFQNRWEVVTLELGHNHPLDPNAVKFMTCFKKFPLSTKDMLQTSDKVDVPPNNSLSVAAAHDKACASSSFNKMDFRDKMDNTRKLGLAEGDIEALIGYFDSMQLCNVNFFYSLDMNEDGQLRNVFWADAKSRGAYHYYGDVITFDVTKLKNLCDILFASFVGMNHHGQTMLLGCGLLADKTAESYIWLFKKWLRCMNDRPPNAIITDQCENIPGAIEKVFPTIRHRFCLQHILEKLEEKFGGMEQTQAISIKFNEVVYDTITVSDFEKEWHEMIEQFHLQDNEWLSNLFEVRKQWAPVFVKETFWAGMSIAERSENTRTFLDAFLTCETSLVKFLEQYDDIMKSNYEKETYEDLRSSQTRPQVVSVYPFEEQISKAYTMNMFQKFQDEVNQILQLKSYLADRKGSIVSYIVTELVDGNKFDYRVVYNNIEEDIWCICRLFQYKGILCRHALSVLRQEMVMLIPSKYIISRWRKDFKRLHASMLSPYVAPVHELGSYDELYMRGHQYFVKIVEIGAKDLNLKECALSIMKEVRDKVIAYEKSLREQRVDADMAATNYSYDPVNDDFADDELPITLSTNGWDPTQAHPRSRKRKKKQVDPRGNVSSVLKMIPHEKENTSHRDTAIDGTQMQHDQHNEGWSLTPAGMHEGFPYGGESISFDLSQYNGAPNFQWHDSSRSRLLWKEQP
ncbi:protein FAR1-RELATED SEQUENCE 6-like [Typha angustifolia]|uniref:protein FAR1-RELATED SEQUENCE 6-like n=1 Tax=Typha angustifolia TaxID=59011 RepID=UPI003C2FB6AF